MITSAVSFSEFSLEASIIISKCNVSMNQCFQYIFIWFIIVVHLIHRNILPTDQNKKIKLIIYYNEFKTSNLVIRNNSSPSIGVLQKNNVIYQLKCPFGDCISDNINIYVGLTSATLSRRLTRHISDTISLAFKKHSCPTFSSTTQQY